jgi:hypothetical protein
MVAYSRRAYVRTRRKTELSALASPTDVARLAIRAVYAAHCPGLANRGTSTAASVVKIVTTTFAAALLLAGAMPATGASEARFTVQIFIAQGSIVSTAGTEGTAFRRRVAQRLAVPGFVNDSVELVSRELFGKERGFMLTVLRGKNDRRIRGNQDAEKRRFNTNDIGACITQQEIRSICRASYGASKGQTVPNI